MGKGNITITGKINNECAQDQSADEKDLLIYTDGGNLTLGSDESPAVLYTSGFLDITNDPSIEEWEFDVMPELRSDTPLAPACSAVADPIVNTLLPDSTAEIAFSGKGIDPDGGPVEYVWDFGDGTTSTQAEPLHSYDAAGIYAATLTATDDDGQTCQAALTIIAADGKTEEEPQSPAVQIEPYDLVMEAGEETNFNVSIFNFTEGDSNYEWDFGDGSTSSLAQPTHTFAEPGLYPVSLTVTNEQGQKSSASTAIYVYPTQPANPGKTAQLAPVQLVLAPNIEEPTQILSIVELKAGKGIRKRIKGDLTIGRPGRPGSIETSAGESGKPNGKPAGDITIFVTGELAIRNGSEIRAGSGGNGKEDYRGGSGGDIYIYAKEDIKIDDKTKIIAGPGGQGGGTTIKGGSGGRGGNVKIYSRGSIKIGDDLVITAGKGGDGGAASGKCVFGGHGGPGGKLIIRAKKDLYIDQNTKLYCGGNGGNGGSATATAGVPQVAWSKGGNGGKAGYYYLAGKNTTFDSVEIYLGTGGKGGEAISTGDAVAPNKCPDGDDGANATASGGNGGSATGCYSKVEFEGESKLFGGYAGNGGNATATGGQGGNNTCPREAIGGDGGAASASGGDGGRVGSMRCADPKLILSTNNDTYPINPFTGGEGGKAASAAGAGGEANAIPNQCGQDVRAVGGSGGKASAFGGNGGAGDDGKSGNGGNVTVTSGKGGNTSAKASDCGKVCKNGGDAKAIGGDGGDIFAVRGGSAGSGKGGISGTAIYTIGLGGNAAATGGKGGDCDECPSGKGGAGGSANAEGGAGGYYSHKSERANGGTVNATGGNGGSGAACCVPVVGKGGDGGKGGDTDAKAKYKGIAAKQGGDGGQGGIGIPPGDGGAGGNPGGKNGENGVLCDGKKDEQAAAEQAAAEQAAAEQVAAEEAAAEQVAAEEAAAEQVAAEEVPGAGLPPEVLFIEFPIGNRREFLYRIDYGIEVPIDGTQVEGLIGFSDPDDDVNYAWFTPCEGSDFKPFGFYIKELESGSNREGIFKFYITCDKRTDYEVITVFIQDASGNWNIQPPLFSFMCR